MTRTVVMARSNSAEVFPVMKALPTHTRPEYFIIQPESYGATVDEGFIVGGQLVILNFCFATERFALSGRA